MNKYDIFHISLTIFNGKKHGIHSYRLIASETLVLLICNQERQEHLLRQIYFFHRSCSAEIVEDVEVGYCRSLVVCKSNIEESQAECNTACECESIAV